MRVGNDGRCHPRTDGALRFVPGGGPVMTRARQIGTPAVRAVPAGQQAGGGRIPPLSVAGLHLGRRALASLSPRALAVSARHLPRRSLVAAGAFCLSGLAQISTAQAVQGCAERDRVVNDLTEGARQHRVAVMLSDNAVIELFVEHDSGAWTAIRVSPDGRACVIDFGPVFFAVRRPPQGEPL